MGHPVPYIQLLQRHRSLAVPGPNLSGAIGAMDAAYFCYLATLPQHLIHSLRIPSVSNRTELSARLAFNLS